MDGLEFRAERSAIGFGVVKQLLREIGYRPRTKPEALAYRILQPDDEEALRAQEAGSLTEAAVYDDQIRFFLKARAVRSFRNTILGLQDVLDGVRIRISQAERLDEGSLLWLETLATLRPLTSIVLELGDGARSVPAYEPSARERTLEDAFALTVLDDEGAAVLREGAKTSINAGDSWSAERLLRRLLREKDDSELFNMLGLTYTLLDRTIEAESFYRRWRDSGGAMERARADYALAMLYARHHPDGLRSLETASMLLDEGYEQLATLSEDDYPSLDFRACLQPQRDTR